ncbi:MAG: MAPEG family protein, partial [Pseudanabaenaceae cyanobacterium]
VFMLFAAAALCVYVSRGGSDATNTLIVTFLAARLGFSLFYLLNIPWLRSPMWVISMICVGGLFNASLH